MKNITRKSLLAAAGLTLALVSASSASAGTFVDIMGPSYHTQNHDHHLNNTTPGLALGYSFSPEYSVRVGGYRNSYRHPSWFVEADALPVSFGPVRLGAGVGLVTGYRCIYPHPIAPMVGLVAQVAISKTARVELRVLPYTGSKGSKVFNIGMQFAI